MVLHCTESVGGFCGNQRVEGEEECDAGSAGDACCDSSCHLKPGAICRCLASASFLYSTDSYPSKVVFIKYSTNIIVMRMWSGASGHKFLEEANHPESVTLAAYIYSHHCMFCGSRFL